MNANPDPGHSSVLEPAPRHKPPVRPARPKRTLRTVGVIIAGIVILLGVVWWMNRGEEQNARERANRPRGGGRRGGGGGMFGPMPVRVQSAARGDLNLYLNALGTVTPLANVTIRTQVSGQLMQVNFQEGQIVNRGDLLAVIDTRPYAVALEQAQGQLLQAQAQLTEAQADLSRYLTLAQQDSISKQQVDAERALVSQDQGLVKTDQAAVDNANLNLTYCHITAPITGRVGLRQVDAGNYITVSDSNGLVVLAQIKPISVIFTLPEDNIPAVAARLKSGANIPVTVYDRNQTKQLASGKLSTIDNEVDTTTGTIKLRALFSNEEENLFANQFVNVRMLLDVDRDALVIPTSSIELGQQGPFVYVVGPDDIVSAHNVTLGPTEGERVAVLSGIAEGDRVVIDGADKLKDGVEVSVQAAAPDLTVPNAPVAGRRRRGEGGGPGGPGGPRRERPAGGAQAQP
jgi:multidrug efflux system membrane fusion protein